MCQILYHTSAVSRLTRKPDLNRAIVELWSVNTVSGYNRNQLTCVRVSKHLIIERVIMRPVQQGKSIIVLILEISDEIPAFNEELSDVHDSGSSEHSMYIMPRHSTELCTCLFISCPGLNVLKVCYSTIVVILSREDHRNHVLRVNIG